MAEKMRKKLLQTELERPTLCKACSGVLVYKGIGEYKCEECGALEYDDYGKVRNYLEKHRGANVAEISGATDVSHKAIREMIKERRFEIVDNRGGYLRCEICGEGITSGRLCSKCEESYHRDVEAKAREDRKKGMTMTGYGEASTGERGSKRFTRER